MKCFVMCVALIFSLVLAGACASSSSATLEQIEQATKCIEQAGICASSVQKLLQSKTEGALISSVIEVNLCINELDRLGCKILAQDLRKSLSEKTVQ